MMHAEQRRSGEGVDDVLQFDTRLVVLEVGVCARAALLAGPS